MKEPQPNVLKPPIEEPSIDVGVILSSDSKQSITIEACGSDFDLTWGKESFNLEDSCLLKIIVNDDIIEFSDKKVSKNSDLIAKPSLNSVSAKAGLKIDSVTAGRGFHWQKETVQIYPGSFRFFVQDGNLVLVNSVPFDAYLACLITSEMSAKCPVEFMKAQAVAARSWAYVAPHNRHPNEEYIVCNDDHCQRYQGTTNLISEVLNAVKDCHGEFLIDKDGNVISTYYSKSCGGFQESVKNAMEIEVSGITANVDGELYITPDLTTEDGFNAWLDLSPDNTQVINCSSANIESDQLVKYLGAVDDSAEYFRWKHFISAEELIRNLERKFNLSQIKSIKDLKPGKRGVSGRILSMSIEYINAHGELDVLTLRNQFEVRNALSSSFLYSSAFAISSDRDADGMITSLKLRGAGWGHGVGLCQIGALGMSLKGASYQEILSHYFRASKLVKSY